MLTSRAAACQRAGLPGIWREREGKSSGRVQRRFAPRLRPHDLRHTAASWHYAVHRDLLALQAQIMLLCSLANQSLSVWLLCRDIEWRPLPPFLLPGATGVLCG